MVSGAGTHNTVFEGIRLDASDLVVCASYLVRAYNLKVFSLQIYFSVVDV